MNDGSQTAPPKLTPPTTRLGPLLAVNFAGSLGFTIVMPFLVFLVMQGVGTLSSTA